MSSMPTDPDPRLPLPVFVQRLWSITGRLSLLFVGSTAILLLVAAGYLYWGLQQSLDRGDRALVRGKLQVMQAILREENDQAGMLENEIEHEAAANELLKYYLRVLDARGRVLIETTGMSGFLPVLVFPEPAPFPTTSPLIVERTISTDRSYLLLSAEVAASPNGQERRILQIALDVEHNYVLLAEYRWKLLTVLCAGLIFAAVAGVLLTRTGLRPLRAIAQSTQRISAHNLAERLNPADWPGELHELAAAFNAMLDRLQDSFDRLTEFSADIAHALRNPINNLRGEAEVALGQVRSLADYQQTLGSSLEEYERLARMIDGLLFIARTDNPAATIEHSPLTARAELDAVHDFYEALASEKKVAVHCEGEARLTGDPMLLRRAVSNLLANALKHTPPGGKIVLAARNLADGSAEIRVNDNGPGIAAEHLPRIFDRFYQVSKSRDQTSLGAGLGLAIVQSIMRLHKGQATVSSELDRGTTVNLTFPPQAEPSSRESSDQS